MKNLLLTGPPRSGKSTVIMEVVKRLSWCERGVTGHRAPSDAARSKAFSLLPGKRSGCGGFYSGEIKERGRRMGFTINTLDGSEGVLAHVDIKGPPREGPYGVNLDDLERIAVPSILEAARTCRLIVIDEIGKMELFSPRFREAVMRCLDCAVPVLGTIREGPHHFTDTIKGRPDVQLIAVTAENRGSLPEKIFLLIDEGE